MLSTRQSPSADVRPLVALVLSDGKRGHENQSMGLVDALSDLLEVQPVCLPAIPRASALTCILSRRLPKEWDQARVTSGRPDLIIGAGSRTHLSILAAKRTFPNSRTIVLMRPGLPLRFFDLCLIPQHDDPPERANVIVTRGALNRIKPAPHHDTQAGLFLIGGPSKHHGWHDEEMIEQISEIIEADAEMQWTLTTSRRTPASFLETFSVLGSQFSVQTDNPKPKNDNRLTIVPASQTAHGWVAEQLARCGNVWVSEDSVSMVYEALTAGARVGILNVPRKRTSRLTKAMDSLKGEGVLVRFEQWQSTRTMGTASGLSEAQRCAKLIFDRWFA